MKRFFSFRLGSTLTSLVIAFVLSGCFSFGDNYTVRTKANSDGSLDRSVSFHAYDSVSRAGLEFGAADSTGWTIHSEKNLDSTKDGKYTFHLTKHYVSLDEANKEASSRSKGYRIASSMESHYQWFFTTTHFTDTYSATMVFANASPDVFFTPEDLTWLDAAFRGDTTVTADTIRGEAMKDKVESFMAYGYAMALAQELGKRMVEQGIDRKWVDTLDAHTTDLARLTQRNDANEETLWSYLIDSLGLPISTLPNARLLTPEDVLAAVPIFDEIEHTIEMPYDITASNSLLVNQNTATWYLTPYAGVKEGVLHVESRKLNLPEIFGTLAGIVALFLILRRKRSA